MKRRDFLAGVAVTATVALPHRAAFAADAPAAAPADTEWARLAIFPAIGIGRVGNSAEWFLAPEIPGLPPRPDGHYKDAAGRIKKQVQRFRVYAFNRSGEVIREVTEADARIDWTVHVANTKAAWYGFSNPLDNGEAAPALPGQKRNQFVVDDAERAAMLVINPGARTIAGRSVNEDGADSGYAMMGRFWRTLDVKLGHLQTDDAGRLMVFPGEGRSRSAVPNNPITNFSDNDGWHDDWCDGSVAATVTLPDGRCIEADTAWLACCGPDFAPEIPPFVSLYDVVTEVAAKAGWIPAVVSPVSFKKHVYPLLRRLALMEWVSAAHNLTWPMAGTLEDADVLQRLSNPGPDNAAFRQSLFRMFRDPHSDEVQQYRLPYMLGDGVNYNGSPLRWLRIPDAQYAILQAWAEGRFTDDHNPDADETSLELADLPLGEQPEALTRAALEPCSGGAFHPGVELTWPLRHKELFQGAYRIALAKGRRPDLVQNLGQLLTAEKAFGGFNGVPPAVAGQMPGDLTRWMGVPWQCDAFSCQQVVFSNDIPSAVWWPALLPIDVLPEAYYNVVMDPGRAPRERADFAARRVSWSRGVAGIGYHAAAGYGNGLNQMVSLWDRMGFVVRRPGPQDPGRPAAVPDTLYVEVDRGSMDLFEGGTGPSARSGE